MQQPLAGLRVVATRPPVSWFGGIDFNFAVEMADELRQLGASVFDLDVSGFAFRNGAYVEDVTAALKTFRPDVAIALPNAGYALICNSSSGENLFRDILQLPTVLLWDHGLFQFPKLLLDPLPRTAAEASQGAIARLRQALNHQLYFHYSPDSGHIDALDKLGILARADVRLFLQPSYPNFTRSGYRAPGTGGFRTRVAFAGNVYLEASQNVAFRDQPELMGITAQVLATKKDDLAESLWDLTLAAIESMKRPVRTQLKLEPDSSFFWSFVHDAIEVIGNTDIRLSILRAINQAWDFFGNFIEPAVVSDLKQRYGLRLRRSLDYFTELPHLFRESDVIVDVVSQGYNTGTSPKVMGCFASGGLVLFDYKADFLRGMGDVAEQVMYRTADGLNSLIEMYLKDSRRRRDVASYLQYRACTDFSFAALCRRIFVDEPVWRT